VIKINFIQVLFIQYLFYIEIIDNHPIIKDKLGNNK